MVRWHHSLRQQKTAFEACDDCDHPEDCQIRAAMTDVRDAIATILDGMTLEELSPRIRPPQKPVNGLTHALTQLSRPREG